MDGAHGIVEQLRREGVDTVFGVPGAQVMGLLDALYDAPDIRYVTNRHEQGSAYMADGYARVTGNPGVLMTVPGVGVYNACAGMATAYACSSPILLLAGQVNRDKIGRRIGILHEVHDQLEVVKPVTKWAARVLTGDDLPAAVNEAFRQMRSGRPRPTELEFPPEALAEPSGALVDGAVGVPVTLDDDQVSRAASVLARAERPLIVAGGGAVISDASVALRELADALQALVLVTREGKAAIDNRHPLFVGSLWANTKRLRALIEDADVILGVGTRFEGVTAGPGQTVVRIDIDAEAHPVAGAVDIGGDAGAVLGALRDEVAGARRGRPSRADEARQAREALQARLRALGPAAEIVDSLRSAIPDDAVIAGGTTTVGYMCHAYLPIHSPRGYLATSYMGTLGFSLSMGLGAKLGAPERPVVTISGDGGFLFGVGELATAVQYGINTVNIVCNDNAYGNPNREQRDDWGGREIGTELRNPDFVALAESFGADATRAETSDQLAGAVKDALSNDRPTVIEFPHGRLPYVMRDPGETKAGAAR